LRGNGKTNGKAGQDLVRRVLKGPHRRHKRYRTQSLLIDNPVEGRVVNVGQAGFAIETLEGLSVGETYLFKVRLGEKHLRLSGRIQWCRLTSTASNGGDETLPIYKAGVALVETVASKAWQVALRRMTEEPAYLVWHRTRSKSSLRPLPVLRAEVAAPESCEQLSP
jgi:hypothetical protein